MSRDIKLSSEQQQQDDVHVKKELSANQSFLDKYISVIKYLRREQGAVKGKPPSLFQKCVAEAFGTGVIVMTGVGSVNAAVFTGAQIGLWQVAVVWGFGVTLAILTTAAVSGAHLNPAVSLAFALLRPDEFRPSLLLPYWVAQLLGGFVAAFLNYAVYHSVIDAFEERFGITRGSPESVLSAMAFGEYFPNPGFHYDGTVEIDGETVLRAKELQWDQNTVTAAGSFGIEALGTGFLMIVILAVTDARNTAFVSKEMAPFFIGFTVSVLISLYAPLNQAGFNPARDFGPRLASFVLGWGEVAIPGPAAGFWTYIIGPLVGAPIGAAFYDFVLRPPSPGLDV